MGVYVEFIKKSFQQQYAYRANAYIRIISTLINLSVQISVWEALIKGRESVNGITFSDMVNFVVINMIALSLSNTDIGSRLAEKISNGSIVIDFIRPVSLKVYLFSEELGSNVFRTIFSTIPACIMAVIVWKFKLPTNILNLLFFTVSIILGIALNYYINYVLGLLAFWFKTSFYVDWILGAFFTLFSGTFVPLWFYPKVLYDISKILPLRFVTFEPIQIYLGKLSYTESLKTILIQLFWFTALVLLERFTWSKAQTTITVQGG
jgi:ABC-2 type transport system permease protein